MAEHVSDVTGERTAGAVSQARAQFLESGAAPSVRSQIQLSWARSASLGVDPSELHPVRPRDDDRGDEVFDRVGDVLARAATAFEGEPVSIIFAAPSGRVLHWYCADAALRGRLEAVSLVPGVGYGEAHVGTNGIGTALELGRPTLVVGQEHFNERLSMFACAGAPLHHPVTGALLGVVDITCAASLANPLLLGTARAIAVQLQDALAAQLSGRDTALLRDYLATSRDGSEPVLALSDDVLMLNRSAQDLLSPQDRAAVVSRTSQTRVIATAHSFRANLPSGAVADLSYAPTFHHGALVGGVLRLQLDPTQDEPVQASPEPPVRPTLPGVVGVSEAWTDAVGRVRELVAHQRTVLVRGEAGVGKLSLLKAVHFGANGSLHIRVFDCAAVGDVDRWIDRLCDDLEDGCGTIVLQHLERLPAVAVEPLVRLLRQHAPTSSVEGPHWIVATHTVSARPTAIDAVVAPHFDATVTLAPLRERPDDIPVLARSMMQNAGDGEDVRLTPDALAHLARLPWPGNAAHLHEVVRHAARHQRNGLIDVWQLPEECLAVPDRPLSVTESLERDAIVRALREHRGDTAAAARALGLSVALLSRQAQDFGVLSELLEPPPAG
ncbi:sigma-54-dependent Fis family transcriptional regulator [Luteipulveratus flavus]|uniref:Helix-turn-helix domain-containing protein n=1 Tax=Luteipulveratus flavus TaxID=3031728 RepID=A0ABT6C9K4_9MICO|nr:helix-turn-helix domain-containing protein [Luteipulveratus sp. YIM 133296]MDF8265198.1 helix-turn-helix domain-containing protein [Luteipulveratus sp. YIM 133296]